MMASSEQKNSDMKLGSKGGGFIPLQDEYLSSIMDVRSAVHQRNNMNMNMNGTEGGKRRMEYKRSFSQGHHIHGKRIFFASYFSVESMLLLVCLTASLLLLPLILPPLPPPPFMLLLLPICILGLLMFLAFMPSSNVRDASTNYTTYL